MLYTKRLLICLMMILCSGGIIIAQQYEIVYSLHTSFGSTQNTFFYNQLISNDISYAEFDNEATNLLRDEEVYYDKSAPKPFILYLPKEGYITCTAYIQSKNLIIKEKTPLITWKETKETKEILGHSCQKVTTSFRGRLYSLWLTTELGVIGGVGKFVGLPGYVMAAYSEDGEVEYLVKSIKLSEKPVPDKKILIEKYEDNFITWAEYEGLFRKYIKRLRKYIAAESDDDVELTFGHNRVEIIEY